MADKETKYVPVLEMIKSVLNKKPVEFLEHYQASMDTRLATVVEAYSKHIKETMFVESAEIFTLKEFLEKVQEAFEKKEDEEDEDKKEDKDKKKKDKEDDKEDEEEDKD